MGPVPSIEEFRLLRSRQAKAPLVATIPCDFDTPVSLFARWKNEDHAFLLESVEGGEKWGRYSFLGLHPLGIFKSIEEGVEIVEGGKKVKINSQDPLGELRKFLGEPLPPAPGQPRFAGGAVGYVSYDAIRFFEKIHSKTKKDGAIPEFYFIKPGILLVHDNLKHQLQIYYFSHKGESLEESYQKGCDAIQKIIEEVKTSPKGFKQGSGKKLSWKGSLTQKQYETKVARVKEYVLAGDITQTVLSLQFVSTGDVDPFGVYRRLRQINPSPYLFYLKFGEVQVVGASPETMVRLEGNEMTLRPIAGTCPRGKNKEEDLANEKELLADPKERAEHIMLVDLGRNDLGRVAEAGSVNVDELMTIERYSHVMHIVSNVRAKLKKGMDAFDLLKASFPAGTLSGSPKIRALEIIEELEPVRRGPYGGCAGYFSSDGNMDMAITIRSAYFYKGKVFVQAGAGIVADSVPTKEYEECLNKAKGMMEAIEE